MAIKAIPLAMVLAMLVAELALYPYLPDILVTHWGVSGQPDGYMSKFWFNALFSLLTVGIYGLFVAIPRIDPLRENIRKFMGYYYGMVILFTGFMLYLYLAVAYSSFGYPLDIQLIIIPAVSGLLFYAGLLCEKSKRNWFVGVRTPWTLSSDRVWEKTNRLGGRLLEAYAVVLLASLLLGQGIGSNLYYVLVIPVLAITAFIVAYSYFEYRKEEKPKRRRR